MQNVNGEAGTKAAKRDQVSFMCGIRGVLTMHLNQGSAKLREVWFKRALAFSVL